MLIEHIHRLAAYNAWMNTSVYQAAGQLGEEQLQQQRGAFFGSIFGTLHHIALADRIWLGRFAEHPAAHPSLDPIRAMVRPATLDAVVASDFGALRAHRAELDAIISDWAGELDHEDLVHVLRHANTKGQVFHRQFAALVMHFFNHQTHHRGQASTLLSQAGVDIGPTDLLVLIPSID